MRALVTGGAGLVGSSLCRRLLEQGARVFCVDNFTLGSQRHIAEISANPDFQLENWDVSQRDWHKRLVNHGSGSQSFDVVFHLAANSDISLGHKQPQMDAQRTFQTTFETLLAAKDMGIPHFVFSSTSAVYGKDPQFPTPEASPCLHPVSVYGAGKLASENFISAFVENYGLSSWVFRFGNVVGQRLTHGVIYDFVARLRSNPHELIVLGNGMQNKTYIDVEDCVSGILAAYTKSPGAVSHESRFQIFNLSTAGSTTVTEIAEETNRVVTSGAAHIVYGSSSVGWVGDVAKTSLDVSRISKIGWAPQFKSTEAVYKSVADYFVWSQGH